MRRLFGCLAVLVVAIFACACVGLGAFIFVPSSVASLGPLGGIFGGLPGFGGGPAVALPNNPPAVSAAAAASMDKKVADFNRAMDAAKPGGDPVTLSLTSQEVNSKLAGDLLSDISTESGLDFQSLQVDFQNGQMLFSSKVQPSGQKPMGMNGAVKLIPSENGVKLEVVDGQVTGVMPFPVPIGPFLKGITGEGGLDIPLDFKVKSIDMNNGQLKLTAVPR